MAIACGGSAGKDCRIYWRFEEASLGFSRAKILRNHAQILVQ
jgi:hypothetical protein